MVANEVGLSEKVCRKGWKSVVDAKRYRYRKCLKSGSPFDINLEMETEYLESSCEPWELQDEINFLEDTSTKRRTDCSDEFDNDTNLEQSEYNSNLEQSLTSSYTYMDTSSSSVSTAKKQYNTEVLATAQRMEKTMSKMVEMAEKENSPHIGFLSHLMAIMNRFTDDDLIDFQGEVMALAYEKLRKR
ncbi:uncharacterized protein LOC142236171 [Haematobia irritans]|uniref:uncharacterized protein LOC142236171 n=1 Tax=Haematobia irritans TaxID=7368 RepID=UPI003F50A8B6